MTAMSDVYDEIETLRGELAELGADHSRIKAVVDSDIARAETHEACLADWTPGKLRAYHVAWRTHTTLLQNYRRHPSNRDGRPAQ